MPDTARVIYNRLARGTPLQMDSTVLYALGSGRGPGHVAGPQDPVARTTRYLNTGLTPTPICMPSPTALARGRASRRREGGCISSWCRRTASWPSPTPTPSSWPTSSWPSPVASPEPRADWSGAPVSIDEARADAGPRTRLVGVIGSPIAHSLSPLLHNAAFAALGLHEHLAVAAPSRCRPGRRRMRWPPCGGPTSAGCRSPCRTRRMWRPWSTSARDVARRLGCGELHRATGTGRLLGTNTDGEGFVASLARGASFTPAGTAVPGHRRRRGRPGRGAGPGRGRSERGRRAQPDA